MTDPKDAEVIAKWEDHLEAKQIEQLKQMEQSEDHPARALFEHADGSLTWLGSALAERDEARREIKRLIKIIKADSRLCVAYRTGGRPPGWALDQLEKHRKTEAKAEARAEGDGG